MLITLSQEKRVRKMHGNDPGSGQNAPGFFLAQKTSDAVWPARKNSANNGTYHIGKGGKTQSKKPSAGRQAHARLNDESHGNAVRRRR